LHHLEAIHNKDYSVVKTLKAAFTGRFFLFYSERYLENNASKKSNFFKKMKRFITIALVFLTDKTNA
jgi:hypothetical protein